MLAVGSRPIYWLKLCQFSCLCSAEAHPPFYGEGLSPEARMVDVGSFVSGRGHRIGPSTTDTCDPCSAIGLPDAWRATVESVSTWRGVRLAMQHSGQSGHNNNDDSVIAYGHDVEFNIWFFVPEAHE